MKLLKYISLSMCALGLMTAATSCNDDDVYDNPSGETIIYNLKVVNGGLSGAETYEGYLDPSTNTYDFVIPAETDIEALRFNGKISLGAHFSQEAYDLSNLEGIITIVNGQNSSDYNVRLTLMEPTATPVLTGMVTVDENGSEHAAFVSDANSTVYLCCPTASTATIKSVTTLPKRSEKVFTDDLGGLTLSASNPGKLVLNFMGRTAEYFISFGATPVFGAEWAEAKTYDYSGATGNIFPDFAAENTRWAQFDGENLFFASRDGGTKPTVVSFASIKAGNPDAHVLDATGIEGGTFTISGCGMAHGHFYACDLTTGLAEAAPLKVYHWASKDAPCETILVYPGTDEIKGRFGDQMSLDLDANGNGYMWFIANQTGDIFLRFEVQNFTAVNPVPYKGVLAFAMPYYGSFNPVPGETNMYTMSSGNQQIVALIDRDGAELNHVEPLKNPIKGDSDPRIISFNGERYLIMASCTSWACGQSALKVFNITSGASPVLAFSEFSNLEDRTPVLEYNLKGGKASAFSANTGAGISPDGQYLRIMGSATKGGFVVIEVPMKK